MRPLRIVHHNPLTNCVLISTTYLSENPSAMSRMIQHLVVVVKSFAEVFGDEFAEE